MKKTIKKNILKTSLLILSFTMIACGQQRALNVMLMEQRSLSLKLLEWLLIQQVNYLQFAQTAAALLTHTQLSLTLSISWH